MIIWLVKVHYPRLAQHCCSSRADLALLHKVSKVWRIRELKQWSGRFYGKHYRMWKTTSTKKYILKNKSIFVLWWHCKRKAVQKHKVWPGQSRACRRGWGCRGCERVVWRHPATRPHPCRPRTQHRHHTPTHTPAHTHTIHSYISDSVNCNISQQTVALHNIYKLKLPNTNSYNNGSQRAMIYNVLGLFQK